MAIFCIGECLLCAVRAEVEDACRSGDVQVRVRSGARVSAPGARLRRTPPLGQLGRKYGHGREAGRRCERWRPKQRRLPVLLLSRPVRDYISVFEPRKSHAHLFVLLMQIRKVSWIVSQHGSPARSCILRKNIPALTSVTVSAGNVEHHSISCCPSIIVDSDCTCQVIVRLCCGSNMFCCDFYGKHCLCFFGAIRLCSVVNQWFIYRKISHYANNPVLFLQWSSLSQHNILWSR